MAIPVPSLSTAGWVTTPSDKADLLFSHFFEAEKSQTYLYGQNVSSLPYLVEQNGNNVASMVQALRLTLQRYLQAYYTGVQVDINVVEDATPRYELQVYASVVEDGKQYSFGKLLQVANSKISKIIDLNNG